MGRRLASRVRPAAAVLSALGILVLIGACGGSTKPQFAPAPSGSTPTGGSPSASQPTPSGQAGRHVILVIEENHSLDQVIGSPLAPQLNRIAGDGTLLTQMYATRHPSLPNYIALLSGDTHGITSDCGKCIVKAPNLIDELEAAHISWKAYMQGLPAPCSANVRTAGAYAKKHNPFLYFPDIATDPARCRNVVPYAQFSADAAAGNLPQFAWVTPDLEHDMHGAGEGAPQEQLLPGADSFLGTFYDTLRSSPSWSPDTRLIITWDEGGGGQTGPHSCCSGDAVGGHVATVIAGTKVKPGTDAATYDHYAILRSIETIFGVPYLGKAADPQSTDIPALVN